MRTRELAEQKHSSSQSLLKLLKLIVLRYQWTAVLALNTQMTSIYLDLLVLLPLLLLLLPLATRCRFNSYVANGVDLLGTYLDLHYVLNCSYHWLPGVDSRIASSYGADAS